MITFFTSLLRFTAQQHMTHGEQHASLHHFDYSCTPDISEGHESKEVKHEKCKGMTGGGGNR